jgi:hypothetical protein
MTRPYRAGIVVLLFLLAVTAACVQTPVTQTPAQTPATPAPDTGRTEVHYKLYGGFVMPSYAIQELVVTPDKATFTIMSADGNVTEKFGKPLTRDQFTAIVKVFTDNNFTLLGDRYEEGRNHIADVGFSDITFTRGSLNKTVTVYNSDSYLPDGLILIRKKLRDTIEYVRAPDENEVRQIAEEWIKGAPTYAYDGSGLTLVTSTPLESIPPRDQLTYRFTGSHGGYGNRTGMVTDPAITPHTIVVTVAYRNVESAVIDERWDEAGQFIIGSRGTLTYQPMQCEQTPWDAWEEKSGRRYIRAPTEEEIVRHYYSSEYGIELMNFTRVDPGMMTCQACSVCPLTHYYMVTVNASGMQPLLDEGWVRSG